MRWCLELTNNEKPPNLGVLVQFSDPYFFWHHPRRTLHPNQLKGPFFLHCFPSYPGNFLSFHSLFSVSITPFTTFLSLFLDISIFRRVFSIWVIDCFAGWNESRYLDRCFPKCHYVRWTTCCSH